MEKKYFLSTRKLNGIHGVLTQSSKKNFESNYKQETEIRFLKLKRIISLKMMFFLFHSIIRTFFSKEKLLELNYKNISLSNHVIATTFRDHRSYTNKFIFHKNVIKNIYFATKIIDFVESSSKNIIAAYIDHILFLNGILFQCLAQRKILIYTNQTPKGVFKVDFNKTKKKTIYYENILAFSKIYRINKLQITKSKKILNKIIYKSKILPWLSQTKYSSHKNFNYSEISHVVYAHSFTDELFPFGNDGFINAVEWLYFTISNLLKNSNKYKILLKPHPNFYNKDMEYSIHDIKIFNHFKKKIKNNENIIVMDKPTRNFELLKKLEKKTILVSHHSTAILEGIYFGFKLISSDKTFWDCSKLKLTNSWSSKENYKLLLNKKWQNLSYANKNHFYSVIKDYFFSHNRILCKDFFINILLKRLKIKNIKFNSTKLHMKISNKFNKLNLDMKKKIIDEISMNIENINL